VRDLLRLVTNHNPRTLKEPGMTKTEFASAIAAQCRTARLWKPITRTKLALPDPDESAKIENKLDRLQR